MSNVFPQFVTLQKTPRKNWNIQQKKQPSSFPIGRTAALFYRMVTFCLSGWSWSRPWKAFW